VGLAAVALAGIATFGIIQLVPYGRDHTAPPGSGEPQWATPQTRELMVDACFSCHSNETEYPVYASIAPISWMVQRHVDEGREKVNYSDFATDPGEADESIEVIQEGEMPPGYYTRFGLHPEAKLSDAEMQELIAGLRATPGLADED
jgi:mono/diheme cytochrome c family protein